MEARGFAFTCWWYEVPATYPGGTGGALRHQAEPGDEEGARRRKGGELGLPYALWHRPGTYGWLVVCNEEKQSPGTRR
jgi:hypothetical protein